ncbi:MAG TPA: fucose isomerase, partial [Edaphobacter sp.]
MKKRVYLVTSGDLRQSANQTCWPAQAELEARLTKVFSDAGCELIRAFPYNESLKHGFISSQREGMSIFAGIPAEAPLLFATAAWQYTHHVLPGLRTHRGPILTAANWSGQWPGLVGLLNLNGSLVKAGIAFSTIWSESFEDEFALNAIREWIADGKVQHDLSHVHHLETSSLPSDERELGTGLAHDLMRQKVIL